ncbi:hypothetical protein PHPALM_27934 [Phytophthora palmivora]|uniref:Uncharacterized protein n=1 Tax=Phytophthora palmivora TaxID=4796 RepID=A0A2P4XBF7_9STRA|nr:hypothetical protein PHPALM_27934 [Phytophthora palmivora]
MRKLHKDGFDDAMDLVDRWKDTKIKNFEQVWKADGHNRRMFNALANIVTQQDTDALVYDEFVTIQQDLTEGTTWKTVLRFLRCLRDAGQDFRYNAIAKSNFAIPGRRGTRVLEELKLVDGIYLVGAYNHTASC